MKLVLFDTYKVGLLKGSNVVDLSEAVKGIVHTSPQSLMSQVIAGFAWYRSAFEKLAAGNAAKLYNFS